MSWMIDYVNELLC